MIVSILEIFRVSSLIDLLQCLIALVFQAIEFLRSFGFKDCDSAIDGIAYNHIASSLSVFFIRLYLIPGSCKNARKERMVKVLAIVMVADCPAQKNTHFLCNAFTIAAPDRLKQRRPVPCHCTLIKPLL